MCACVCPDVCVCVLLCVSTHTPICTASTNGQMFLPVVCKFCLQTFVWWAFICGNSMGAGLRVYSSRPFLLLLLQCSYAEAMAPSFLMLISWFLFPCLCYKVQMCIQITDKQRRPGDVKSQGKHFFCNFIQD